MYISYQYGTQKFCVEICIISFQVAPNWISKYMHYYFWQFISCDLNMMEKYEFLVDGSVLEI